MRKRFPSRSPESDAAALDRALADPPRFPAPPDTWTAIERRLEAAPRRPRGLVFSVLAAAAAVLIALGVRRAATPRPAPAQPRLVQAALRIHRERLAGAFGFDLCDGSAERVRQWVCAESGLDAPPPPSPAGGADECAAIVAAAGAPTAVLAWERASGPVTVLTARVSDLGIESRRGWTAGKTFRDPKSGITLLAWRRSDQAFVLASGGQRQSP
jgi:hypothetical protein